MSIIALILAAAAIDVAGLFLIWFFLKARTRRYLELDNLLEGVRQEARALVIELNETADRNVSLVEDRIAALRELLGEVDRRIGVARKELDNRSNEREVYARLAQRRPIVPSADHLSAQLSSQRNQAQEAPQLQRDGVAAPPKASQSSPGTDAPIPLSLGGQEPRRQGGAIPELVFSDQPVKPAPSKREQALDLHRKGFSVEMIAARVDATVAEIELLVEMEERRSGS